MTHLKSVLNTQAADLGRSVCARATTQFCAARLSISVRATVLLSMLVCGTNASALSLGQISAAPVLNAPLFATVPVTLTGDETLDTECVRAEVYSGEDRLNPKVVRTELLGSSAQRQIRVRTTVRLIEPIVSLFVEAGCQSRVSRRYTLLVDPSSPQDTEPAPLAVQPSAAAEPMLPLAPAQSTSDSSSRSVVRRADAPTLRGRATPRVADAAPSAPQAAAAQRSVVRKPAAAKPARALVPEAKPKLTLDIATEFADSASFRLARELQVTAPAVDDARRAELRVLRDALVAELSGTAEPGNLARKIAELEQNNQALTAQLSNTKAQAAAEKAVREKLERERFSPWVVYALIAALAAALAGLGWLALRRRVDKSLSSPFLVDEPQAVEAVPQAAAASAMLAPRSDVLEHAIEEGFVSPETLVRPGQSGGTFVYTQPHLRPAQTRAALSVSELVAVSEVADISQEAEFFIEIGEYERAIELLEQHSGAEYDITPVPQLYLFDLYRRTGKRAEYDKLHAEFTSKYNAFVPRWVEDPALNQRELLDYDRALEHICRVWRGSELAYELETLLVDDTDGRRLGFDLPAYRDIIFLYGIAKQLSLDDEDFYLGLPATAAGLTSDAAPELDFELPSPSAELSSTYDRALAIDLDFDAFARRNAQKPGEDDR
jgi:pilus assembly protein FimV